MLHGGSQSLIRGRLGRRAHFDALELRLDEVERLAKALSPAIARFPAESLAGQRNVRLPNLWIVLRQRLEDDLALAAGELDDLPREVENRDLVGVYDVDGVGHIAEEQAIDALHRIVDVLEGSRLIALAVDGERLAMQRLIHESRQRPAIVEPHARSKRVEDANDAGLDAVIPMVGHGHGLSEAFGFVVDTAQARRVHITPVGLRLRMHQGIAVDLTRGGQQQAGTFVFGETERLVRAQRTDLQRLNGILQVVDRGGRAGKMKHIVQRSLDEEVVRDVELDELKAGISDEMGDVLRRSRDEVVDAD